MACGWLKSPGPDPSLPHCLDELARLVELQHARVAAAVPFADEDVAAGRDVDVIGLEEVVRSRRAARLAEGEQHLPVRAELEHLVSLGAARGRSHGQRSGRCARSRGGAARRTRGVVVAVDNPDVAVAVHGDAMREDDEARTEALHELAGRVELQDRIERGGEARVRAAALADPDAHAVLVDIDRTRGAPRAAFGHLRPALDRAVRIGPVVLGVWRRLGLCLRVHGGEDQARDRGGGQGPPELSILHNHTLP